ncbi:MAG: DNA mismatch repair endonuclease MutL [Thermodesulfobacteriota bacterium]
MSGLIGILPENLINMIAAGEVVERPASVVKELLENSVDAGASDIGVEILQAGRSSIRITDNGQGMSREDLVLAVERHATSKIRDYADLSQLRSMGFRGEALPSIASVSRMTIISIPRGESSGHRLEIWGGKKISLEEVGGASGTVVEIQDLFYNTPARVAFLKSPKAEWGQIQTAVERVALGFPSIRFDLTHNGKKVLRLFPGNDSELRLKELWGKDRINDLIKVDLSEERIQITGLISPPHYHLNTSRNMAFIVNKRWVRSPLLFPLVLRSYAGMIPAGRFPTAILWLDVPPELIDVNIHPFKQEVRFSETTWVQNLVGKALHRALKTYVPHPMVKGDGWPGACPPSPKQPFLFKEGELSLFSAPLSPESEDVRGVLMPGDPAVSAPWISDQKFFKSNQEGMELKEQVGGFSGLTLLSQVRGTYIVAMNNEGLVLIDQHAAHERVLFERYLKQWREGGVSSQYLLIPILFEIPPGWITDPDSILSQIGALGFEVAPAGGNGLWIKSIPSGMSPEQGEDALKEIFQEMKDGNRSIRAEELSQSLLKLLACHSAIRAGQVLTSEETRSLLFQLDQTESPSHCPHGRPLWLLFSWEEIEKRFKRR